MAIDKQALNYRALDEWFKTPQGIRVAKAFTLEISVISQHLQGKKLLQLGSCGENPWLFNLSYKDKWIMTPYLDLEKTTLVASFTALPFERGSIQCIVAPFLLEMLAKGKESLDELDRVLQPMGYIIFWGINPWSIWGLLTRLRKNTCFSHAKINLVSSFTIKHIMAQRGFSQSIHSAFYHNPPIHNENCLKKLEFLNEMGKMISPLPAAFYCLVLQKYEFGVPLSLEEYTQEPLLARRTSCVMM